MSEFLLYNTLTRQKQPFQPIDPAKVTLYSCGPTVYHYVHIGNLRTFVMVDLLKRVLLSRHYHVDHIMNITDVGHLTQENSDSGDDRLQKAATKEGKTPEEIAQFYTKAFLADLQALQIIPPSLMPKATDHVAPMIKMVKELLQKDVAYETDNAIYFDVTKFARYTELSRQKLEDKIQAARQEIVTDPMKRHPEDFAVWFKALGHHANHLQTWDSPWGKGFPGWHIECSAMAREYLGDTLDIHAGGVDLIGTHHTNEIAQSESITGQPLAHFWFHVEHLLINNAKMARSEGTGIRLADIGEKGFTADAFRYLLHTAHYRTKMNFSWNILETAQKTLEGIRHIVAEEGESDVPADLKQKIWAALLDDLDTPKALALLHEAKNGGLWREFGFVFGLDFEPVVSDDEPDNQAHQLLNQRTEAREAKNWAEADRLRQELENIGWLVVDTPDGSNLKKL